MSSSASLIVRFWVISLGLAALAGCSAFNPRPGAQQQFNTQGNSNGTGQVQPASGVPQATPIPQPPEARQAQSGNTTIQPAPTLQPSPVAITQNVTCDATYHTGNITWQQGLPLLTLIRRPSTALLDRIPAALTQNNDGSQTFTVLAAETTTLTFYRDGTCLIQVVGPNDSLTVQETGRSQSTPTPTPTALPPGGGGGVASMTCRGTIDNTVNFVAYYTQTRGFYRIDFSPRASGNVIPIDLIDNGINSQGQRVWRGVNSTAEVALVHLSTGVPQRGDRIAVQYDGRWGAGNCGGLSALW